MDPERNDSERGLLVYDSKIPVDGSRTTEVGARGATVRARSLAHFRGVESASPMTISQRVSGRETLRQGPSAPTSLFSPRRPPLPRTNRKPRGPCPTHEIRHPAHAAQAPNRFNDDPTTVLDRSRVPGRTTTANQSLHVPASTTITIKPYVILRC